MSARLARNLDSVLADPIAFHGALTGVPLGILIASPLPLWSVVVYATTISVLLGLALWAFLTAQRRQAAGREG